MNTLSLETQYQITQAKDNAMTYGEAVLCEVWSRMFPHEQKSFVELSLPEEK